MKYKYIFLTVMLIMGTLLISCVQMTTRPKVETAMSRCKEVLNGDTFAAEDGRIIKLIGVDVEESIKSLRINHAEYDVNYNSKMFLMNTIQGKWIRIEYEDPRLDRSGNTRAYVWLESGELVNELVVEQGWSTVHIGYPFSKMYRLENAEKKARNNRRGVWAHITKESL